ncbi:MAG TPA: ORF6N domain-containing protein, partial [Prolixibacteraceae bacterium]
MSNPENALVIPDEVILSKIYYIRELKVMIDSDLAELYGVETKVLKQQVKRNIDRFPDDFMFELTDEEFANLRSQ